MYATIDHPVHDAATSAAIPRRAPPTDALRSDGAFGFYATVELATICEEPVRGVIAHHTLRFLGEHPGLASAAVEFVTPERGGWRPGDLFIAHLRPTCAPSGVVGSLAGCADHPGLDDLSVVELVPTVADDRRAPGPRSIHMPPGAFPTCTPTAAPDLLYRAEAPRPRKP
jgi:hypothetical protein